MPSTGPSRAVPENPKAAETFSGDPQISQQSDFLKSVFAEITGRRPPDRSSLPADGSRLNTD